MQYELFYLIGAGKEADLEKIKADVEEIVTKRGGSFEEKETREKRKMAYAIKKETHGIYIARRFSLEETEKASEIITKLNLYPDVMRFVLSRAQDLPPLKSKEERIEDAAKRSEEARPKAKTEPQKEKKEVKKRPAEEARPQKKKPAAEEDIDKKLEEILNI